MTDGLEPVPSKPWRLRHPVAARALLYGGLLAVLAAGAAVGAAFLEGGRQSQMTTVVRGTGQYLLADPDRAVRVLEDEVLSQRPEPGLRRAALLALAAAHDAARRYDLSERAYREAREAWPEGLARGPLVVPWANMLVSAGRASEALAMLEEPGAQAGFEPSESVEAVRERARKAVEASAAAGGGRR